MNPSMSHLLKALRERGEGVALRGANGREVSASELLAHARRLAAELQETGARHVACCLPDGPEWVAADLACLMAGTPMVPIPEFFTGEQAEYALRQAGVDTVLMLPNGMPGGSSAGRFERICLTRRDTPGAIIPPATARITFTSGTTGAPKGVCLSADLLDRVAASLVERIAELALKRHLVLLPLAILLENVAGVYAGLIAGAEIQFTRPGEAGLAGSSGFDPARLLQAIERYKPESLIVLPQMLKALVGEIQRSGRRPDGLSFVAVGGARSTPKLISAARSLGLPVFEGYGLSECGSVVALNGPGSDRPGTVGRALSHVAIKVAGDGEVLVRHGEGVSYVGEPTVTGGWFPTGDLGELDDEGYLTLRGRKSNILITGFGRNVSPEWVESELLAEPGIAQALVFGDDLAGLGALIVPAPGFRATSIGENVEQANERLPDYARVCAWQLVSPFLAERNELTSNGRPRREPLMTHHADSVRSLSRQLQNLNNPHQPGASHEIF